MPTAVLQVKGSDQTPWAKPGGQHQAGPPQTRRDPGAGGREGPGGQDKAMRDGSTARGRLADLPLDWTVGTRTHSGDGSYSPGCAAPAQAGAAPRPPPRPAGRSCGARGACWGPCWVRLPPGLGPHSAEQRKLAPSSPPRAMSLHGGYTLMTSAPQSATPNTNAWGLGFQHRNLGATNIQSVTQSSTASGKVFPGQDEDTSQRTGEPRGRGKGGQGQQGVWGVSVVSGAAEVEAGWAEGPQTALRPLTRPGSPACGARRPQGSQARGLRLGPSAVPNSQLGRVSCGPKAALCSAESQVTVDTPKGTVGAAAASQTPSLGPDFWVCGGWGRIRPGTPQTMGFGPLGEPGGPSRDDGGQQAVSQGDTGSLC